MAIAVAATAVTVVEFLVALVQASAVSLGFLAYGRFVVAAVAVAACAYGFRTRPAFALAPPTWLGSLGRALGLSLLLVALLPGSALPLAWFGFVALAEPFSQGLVMIVYRLVDAASMLAPFVVWGFAFYLLARWYDMRPRGTPHPVHDDQVRGEVQPPEASWRSPLLGDATRRVGNVVLRPLYFVYTLASVSGFGGNLIQVLGWRAHGYASEAATLRTASYVLAAALVVPAFMRWATLHSPSRSARVWITAVAMAWVAIGTSSTWLPLLRS